MTTRASKLSQLSFLEKGNKRIKAFAVSHTNTIPNPLKSNTQDILKVNDDEVAILAY